MLLVVDLRSEFAEEEVVFSAQESQRVSEKKSKGNVRKSVVAPRNPRIFRTHISQPCYVVSNVEIVLGTDAVSKGFYYWCHKLKNKIMLQVRMLERRTKQSRENASLIRIVVCASRVGNKMLRLWICGILFHPYSKRIRRYTIRDLLANSSYCPL